MITDVDKSGDDRAKPSPNTHDVLTKEAVLSKGTNSVNYTTSSTDLASIQAAKNGQFTIIQVGNFTTTQTYTTTAPGAGNFITDFFTIYQAPHNLNFLPGIIGYEQSSAGQYSPLPYSKYAVGSGTQALWYTFILFVDNVNVYVQLSTLTYGSASFTFQPGFIFKWYLLQQTSN